MWCRNVFPVTAVLLAAAFGHGERAFAIDKLWNNAAGGNWSVGTNWSPIGAPGPMDHARIDNVAGNYTVTLDVNPTIARLTVGLAGPGAGTQTLSSDSHTLTLTGALASTINPKGAVILRNSTINVTGIGSGLLNSGLIQSQDGTSAVLGSMKNEVNGLIRIQGGSVAGVLSIPNGFTNEGAVHLTHAVGAVNDATLSGGTIINSGTISVLSTGPLPRFRKLNINLDNHGLVDIDAECTFNKLAATHINDRTGTITINGANVTMVRASAGPATGLNNQGNIVIDGGGALTLTDESTGAYFTNNGDLIMTFAECNINGGASTNDGHIGVGTSAILEQNGGSFTHGGSFGQGSGSLIVFDQSNLNLDTDFENVDPGVLHLIECIVSGPASLQNQSGQLLLLGTSISTHVENSLSGVMEVQPAPRNPKQVTSIIGNGGLTNSSATLRVQSTGGVNAVLNIDADFINNGLIELTSLVSGESTLKCNGLITNSNLISALEGAGGTRIIIGEMINNAQLNIQTESIIDCNMSGAFINNGNTIVSGSSGLIVLDAVAGTMTLSNTGDILVAGSSSLACLNNLPPNTSVILNSGEIRGTGTVAANQLQNSGSLAHVGGFAAGLYLSVPTFQQLSTGEVHSRIGGPLAGVSYDQITVTGQALLDGSLFVSFVPIPGVGGGGELYNPPIGQTFDLLTGGLGISGTFRLAYLPGFADERYMLVSYNSGAELAGAASVTVTVNELESVTDFDDGTTFGLPGAPTDGVLGDLDANGTLDLAITIPADDDQDPGSVLILFNGGTVGDTWQGFTSSLQVTVGVFPTAVTTGFFNNDNVLDLAVANRLDGVSNGTVTVLINSFGSPGSSFTPLPPISVGVNPSSIASANLDNSAAEEVIGDDIIVTNRSSDTVSVLIKDPDPAVTYSSMVLPAGREPVEIDPADVEGDRGVGFIDLFVLNQASNDVWVYENLGGSFAAPVAHAVGTTPTALSIGQLNNDPAVDIAVTNQGSGDVSVLINAGAPAAFASAISIPLADTPLSIALADLDNDGDLGFPDLDLAVLVTQGGDSVVQVLRNDTDGDTPGAPVALTSADVVGVDSGAFLVLAGDVDGLGNGDDLVTVNNAASPLAGGGLPNLTVVLNGAAPPCPGDIVGDNGTVNVDDLLLIVNSWGTCDVPGPIACPADITDNGVVDVDDLLEVINSWGDCE